MGECTNINLYRQALRSLRQIEAILITKRALAAKTCPSPELERALAKCRKAIALFSEIVSEPE